MDSGDAVSGATDSLETTESGGRRQLLATLGMLTAGGLAGCSLLDNGEDSTPNTSTTTEPTPGSGGEPTATPQRAVGERQRLAPDELSETDRFGASVSLADGTAVVGAPGDSERKGDAGTAYVLEPDSEGNWHVVDELFPETPVDVGLFGWAAAHDDGHALIGAYYSGEDPRGGLYWFREREDGWERMGEVQPEPVEETNYARGILGRAIAMDGEHALVGESPERAFFLRQTDDEWEVTTEVRPEVAFDNTRDTGFGQVVAIEDGIAAVAAPFRSEFDGAEIDGIVYVYELVDGEWRRQTILSPAANPAQFRGFGHGLAFAGETLLVGAPFDEVDDGLSHTGLINVFERDGGDWSQTTQLTAETESGEELGKALAASETRLVSGGSLSYTMTPGGQSPPVFTFSREGKGDWQPQDELSPGQYVRNFGIDVDISGRTAIIGTQEYERHDGPERGAAYLFKL